MIAADIEEVDDYVARHKTLRSYLRPWSSVQGRQWQARWGIVDESGIENSELCFTVSRDWKHQTIVCLFRQRLIYRLDIAPKSECKPNHHAAWKQNLPHEVCGPHVHGWPENRQYVMENGFIAMPFRRPIDGLVDAFRRVGLGLG